MILIMYVNKSLDKKKSIYLFLFGVGPLKSHGSFFESSNKAKENIMLDIF